MRRRRPPRPQSRLGTFIGGAAGIGDGMASIAEGMLRIASPTLPRTPRLGGFVDDRKALATDARALARARGALRAPSPRP